MGSALGSLRYSHRHAPILEGTGRVQPLVFEVEIKLAVDRLDKVRHTNQWRVSFQQRHHRRGFAHRQLLAVRVNDAAPTGSILNANAHAKFSTRIITGFAFTALSFLISFKAFCIAAFLA